jgi:hypothetical protein
MAKMRVPRKLKKVITKNCIYNANLLGKRFKSMTIVEVDIKGKSFGNRVIMIEQKYKHNGTTTRD